MNTKIGQLAAALKDSTRGEWNVQSYSCVKVGATEEGVSIYIGDDALVDFPIGGGWTSKELTANANFIALAHNMMPALLNLFHAVDAEITPDGELRSMDLSGILSAMAQLKQIDSAPSMQQPDVGIIDIGSASAGLVNFAKAQSELEGLDEAIVIGLALDDDSHSLFDVQVGLFNLDADPRTPYDTVDVAVASANATDAVAAAIKFCRNHIESGASFEAIGHSVLLSNGDISSIRSSINDCDGVTTGNNFARVTGLKCDFQGNSVWEVNGEMLDHNDMSTMIIKSICLKSSDEQAEAMACFSDEDGHRLS